VHLSGANLSGAIFRLTFLSDLDLSMAQGLEDAKHLSHSTIGLDTVYRSQGKIPESFLRGCGVPESFIVYMRSLTRAPSDLYSCFICHSTEDQDLAERLYADLQARGVRCWLAPHDAQGGRKIHEQFDEAIKAYDKLLVILSDASMKSNWMKTEITNAHAREQEQRQQMLFPISRVAFNRIKEWRLYDADTGINTAGEIRKRLIADFSNWKNHDSYQQAFERLVRDLKAQPGDKANARVCTVTAMPLPSDPSRAAARVTAGRVDSRRTSSPLER
jgi:hypothetical protein